MKKIIFLLFLSSIVHADCFCSQANGEIVYTQSGLATGTTNFTYDPITQMQTIIGKDGTDSDDFAHTAQHIIGFQQFNALTAPAGPAYGGTLTGMGLRYVPNEPFSGGYSFVTRTPSWLIENTYNGTLYWGIGMHYNGNILVGDPGSSLRGSYVAHTKLEVLGDISMPIQGNGLILKAIDGSSCYRLRVLNNGTLNTSLISCPN